MDFSRENKVESCQKGINARILTNNFNPYISFLGGDGQTYYTNVPCTGNVRHLVQLLHSYPV